MGSYLTVTDQFCGAGGSSQGVRAVAESIGGGLELRLALNHWALAIETHQTNFPQALHDCTDVSACDPRRYPSTDILITSPECTNHSLAKGQKIASSQIALYNSGKLDPAAERSRATMWDVPRFAEYHNYRLIIVENVVDARRWVMFSAWLLAMQSLGYDFQCVYLNSMHCHPTPQSRDRMYVVFWKKGNRKPDLDIKPLAWCGKCSKDIQSIQSWKRANVRYGKYRRQYVYRCPHCTSIVEPYYYSAFNAIDWSRKGERIGERSKPLADSTMKRIRYGLDKYGKNPVIITTRYTSGVDCRVRHIGRELPTQPGDASHGTSIPFMTYTDHSKANDGLHVSHSAEPMRTQTTSQVAGVCVPAMLIKNYGGNYDPKYASVPIGDTLHTVTTADHHALLTMPFIDEANSTSKGRSIADALCTVTAGGNHHYLVQPPLIVNNKGQSKSSPSLTQGLPTQTTLQHLGLIQSGAWQSFIGYYYQSNQTSHPVTDPIGTCTVKDRHFLIGYEQNLNVDDCYYRMLYPDEIGRAMAFGNDYVVLGNSRDKVKQYGNAVTPPAMEELVRRCVESLM